MKKTYLVEFTNNNGGTEIVTFHTENIKWSIKQWCRNRHIVDHKILEEGADVSPKGLLLG